MKNTQRHINEELPKSQSHSLESLHELRREEWRGRRINEKWMKSKSHLVELSHELGRHEWSGRVICWSCCILCPYAADSRLSLIFLLHWKAAKDVLSKADIHFQPSTKCFCALYPLILEDKFQLLKIEALSLLNVVIVKKPNASTYSRELMGYPNKIFETMLTRAPAVMPYA